MSTLVNRLQALPRWLVIATLVIVAACAVFASRALSPTIAGADSVNRLLHVDQLIVQNHWFPSLQLILQLVHLFADNAVAYKVPVCLLGVAGMVYAALTIDRVFGPWAAAFCTIYFLVHRSWLSVATSLYLEPLMLLAVAGACYYAVDGRRRLAAAFLLAATFTRVEVLMAAPVLALVYWRWSGSPSRALRLLALFAPVVIYWVVVTVFFPAPPLATVGGYATGLGQIERSLGEIFARQNLWLTVTCGPLAVLGIVLAVRQQQRRRWAVAAALVLGVIVVAHALVLPLLYRVSGRKSIYGIFWLFLAASWAVQWLAERPRIPGTVARVVVTAGMLALLAFGLQRNTGYTDPLYDVTAELAGEIERRAAGEGELPFCIAGAADLRIKQQRAYRRLAVYLRFAGWELLETTCPDGATTAATADRPLLEIHPNYRRTGPQSERRLIEQCEYFVRLKRRYGELGLCLRS